MAAHAQFENIYHGLGMKPGKIRLAAAGLGWKSSEGEETVTVPADSIKYMQWMRVARGFQLRVILNKDRKRESFDGFAREDNEKITTLVKQYYNQILEVKEIGVKGWNWGTTDIRGGDISFLVSNKTIFEVPLSQVANSNIAGKTEVSLEFTPQSTAGPSGGKKRAAAPDELMEMRLFVPGNRAKGSDEESGGEEDETSAAQAFHDMIKEKAEIGQVTGEGIVTFSEILVQTPRGRYDIDMFPSFLRLRGKTYDYKILYTSVTRIFLLPKPDEIHVQLVIGLDPPIRQGQTRYPYLVLIFSREEELDIELNLDEETIATKYEGKLQKKYDLPTYRVVSEVFRGLSGRKMIAPGSFASRDNQHGIKANMKAVLGELYFLEKSLIFVAKQPTVIDYADIHQVIFSRVGGGMTSARTFDIRIVTKSGAMTEVTFTSINKEEFDPVEEFLKAKKLRTKNEINDGDVLMAATALDDESDEDMGGSDNDSDAKPAKKIMNGEDDDSEEDEDFEASSSDEGSPSESDSESGASDVSRASGDLDIAKAGKAAGNLGGKKKKKKADDGEPTAATGGDGAEGETPKKKKKKVVKKDDDDGDAAMDEDGDSGKKPAKLKPKPKPKPKATSKDVDDPDAPPKKKPKKEEA
ncbi:FACT complex subunit [Tulasnella sp. JGI-2019a]|nr:FACT complex subunit [Tulasnella sp. JGI-2019a]